MATDQTTSPHSTMRTLLPLAVILLAAGGVTYVMMASRGREPPENSNSAGAHAPGSPVVSITLPYDEPVLPPGPHQREFQIACTTCHSTRLAMTQPPFPKAKWEATVKKMVDAFGAPLTREEQARAVEYLMSVRGK